ncbi:hypothetical protein ES703_31241 [subsurface metagenome]
MVKKVHLTKRYKRTRIKDPKKFDKRSLRIKDVGRKGFTKIIVGCPRGKYDSKRKRCKVGTQVQAVLEERRK